MARQVSRLPLLQNQSTTLLPFLYHTTTLKPFRQTWPSAQPSHAGYATAQTAAQRSRLRKRSDPTPGLYSNLEMPNLTRLENASNSEGSTLTRKEFETFESIYKEILREIPMRYGSLKSDTYREENLLEKMSLEEVFAEVPSSETRDSAQTVEPRFSEDSSGTVVRDKQRMSIEASRQHDWAEFDKLLTAADTDVGVWTVLQTHVFKKVRAFTDAVKQTVDTKEQKSSAPTPQLDGGKAREDGIATKSSMKGKKRQQRKKAEVSMPTRQFTVPAWNKKPEIVKQLSILRTNYASQCALCIHTLRKRFPTSTYAMAVLPEIKSFGHMSYALGVSTELYNELLYLRWVCYRDLHGCADLVSEMLDRSVTTDARTRAVFKDAELQRQQARSIWNAIDTKPDNHQKANAAWWFLQGSKAGWERWSAIEEQAASLEKERRTAAANAEAEDDEDLYEGDEEDDSEPAIQVITPAKKYAAAPMAAAA